MAHSSIAYPSLTKSYKGKFPFKIGTTSFIYPDDYVPNVKMLRPYLDEIELLLFESSGADALPSRDCIVELSRLAQESELTYNVHLPTDISISNPDPDLQSHAVNTILRTMQLVRPLAPSVLTLHVPYDEYGSQDQGVKIWQDRVRNNLEKILSSDPHGHTISIETLDYPFEIMENVLDDLDLSICLDLGHLMVYEYDIEKIFNKYSSNTPIIHLHGVENRNDHKSLDRLPDKLLQPVMRILKNFVGIVSLEIFSYRDLVSSLDFLEKRWTDCQ